MTIYSILVPLLVFFGGQPFAGMSMGDGVMHNDCVETSVLIMCSDGFTI